MHFAFAGRRKDMREYNSIVTYSLSTDLSPRAAPPPGVATPPSPTHGNGIALFVQYRTRGAILADQWPSVARIFAC
jgi:hypothetical protein